MKRMQLLQQLMKMDDDISAFTNDNYEVKFEGHFVYFRKQGNVNRFKMNFNDFVEFMRWISEDK